MRAFLITFILFSSFWTGAQSKEAIQKNSSSFKAIKLENLYEAGKFYGINEMPKQTPVLLFFFRTDCGHCQLDAPQLSKLVPEYGIPFWMASSEEPETVKAFIQKFELRQIKNLHFMRDVHKNMHDWFQFKYIPFIALIDQKGNFIKEFEKLPNPDELNEVIRTHQFLEQMH